MFALIELTGTLIKLLVKYKLGESTNLNGLISSLKITEFKTKLGDDCVK